MAVLKGKKLPKLWDRSQIFSKEVYCLTLHHYVFWAQDRHLVSVWSWIWDVVTSEI